jgi:lipid-binding SYLF domain-containing protein
MLSRRTDTVLTLRARAIAALLLLGTSLLLPLGGCSTAPKAEDQAAFMGRARASQGWFVRNVDGLGDQVAAAPAYIIFPDVAQWGILIGGGNFGRGALMEHGKHTGWAAVNRGSVGLQAGVQGYRMLMVLQDETTLRQFKANQWSGSAEATGVIAEAGGTVAAPFKNGVAVYTGGHAGLMAGASVGLEYVRYQPFGVD